MNPRQPRSSHKRKDAYWNKLDWEINDRLAHTTPILSKHQLEFFYKQNGNTRSEVYQMQGFQRYLIENNGNALRETMQGSVHTAIDIATGRRVVVKAASKKLVDSHQRKNGDFIDEDIIQETQILADISNRNNADSGLSLCTCLSIVASCD